MLYVDGTEAGFETERLSFVEIYLGFAVIYSPLVNPYISRPAMTTFSKRVNFSPLFTILVRAFQSALL